MPQIRFPKVFETLMNNTMQENTKLKDKGVRKVYDSGLELAARGSDPETQKVDDGVLAKAEDRFTMVIEELAPSYTGGYSSRGNVRVARGKVARST